MKKIQSELDSFQLSFAQDSDRAIRLLAPAGSGKTHSLLWRCVQQLQTATGRSKPRFLLFTFTKAARDELNDRLKNSPEFASIRSLVEVATLNSWGYRRLKTRSHNLKLLTEKQELFWAVHNNLQPIWNKYEKIKDVLKQPKRGRAAKDIITVIDGLKSLGFRHDVHHIGLEFANHVKWLDSVGLNTYLANLLEILSDLQIINQISGNKIQKINIQDIEKNFLQFWHEATLSLHQMAMITLEDQKYWAWLELEDDIAQGRYTTGLARVDNIIVDEFQDVNCLDLRLLQAIAKINKTQLTLVGDDDQSIYEWRGASPQFILDPNVHIGQKQYKTHILNNNYRSPRNIVELSQKLIKHNKRRVDKQVKPVSNTNAKLEVLQMPSISACIDYVVTEVRAMLKDSSIKKVAIIGRKRGQIIPYQIVFARHNIPFYAAEDLQVFLSAAFNELKEILAIKVNAGAAPILGADPITNFMKLVNKLKRYPLSKADSDSLKTHLRSEGPRSLFECLESMRRYSGSLKGNNTDGSRSNSFADAIQALLDAKTVAEAILAISNHFEGLQKDYGKSMEDIFYTDPPFLHLAEFAECYGDDYTKFYNDLDKAAKTLARVPDDAEADSTHKEPEWKLPLHLMTALRAKGKEFDAVLILDVNQDIWPSKLATTPEELEQERRVFYVAFTRVRKRLTLLVNDRILGRPSIPSPYLAEMGLNIGKQSRRLG